MGRSYRKLVHPVPTVTTSYNNIEWTKENVVTLYKTLKVVNTLKPKELNDFLNKENRSKCYEVNRDHTLQHDNGFPVNAIKDDTSSPNINKTKAINDKNMTDWFELKRNIMVPDEGAEKPERYTIKIIQATDKVIFAKLLHLLEEDVYSDNEQNRVVKECDRLEVINHWVNCLSLIQACETARKSVESDTKTNVWEIDRMSRFVADFYCYKYRQELSACGVPHDIFVLLSNLITEDAYDIREWYFQFVEECEYKDNSTKEVLQNPILPYRKSFCRLCFVYDCRWHSLVKKDGIHSTATAHYDHYIHTATTNRKSTMISKDESMACLIQDCVKKTDWLTGKFVFSATTKPDFETWTVEDKRDCTCLFKSYKDPCLVAFLMRNKTCKEVFKFTYYNPMAKPLKLAEKSIDNIELLTALNGDVVLPCSHYGKCTNTCPCVIRKVRCEKMCSCSMSCPKRFKGCACVHQCNPNSCPCFLRDRECNPDICKACSPKSLMNGEGESHNRRACKNMSMQNYAKPHVLTVKQSNIAGLGLFTKSAIKAKEFVAEGVGEVISAEETERRGKIYDEGKHTFLLDLEKDGKSVDQTNCGNATRYFNCSIKGNCLPKVMMVNGERRVGYYAQKNIAPGSELTFNYVNVLEQHQVEIKSVPSKK